MDPFSTTPNGTPFPDPLAEPTLDPTLRPTPPPTFEPTIEPTFEPTVSLAAHGRPGSPDSTGAVQPTGIPGLAGLPRSVRSQRRLALGAGALAAVLLVIGCTAGALGSGTSAGSTGTPVTLDAPTDSSGAASIGTSIGASADGVAAPSPRAAGSVDPTGTGGSVAPSSPGSGTSPDGTPLDTSGEPHGAPGDPEAPDDATEDGLDDVDDSDGYDDSSGDGDGAPQPQPEPQPEPQPDDSPVELDPVDQPAAGPCDLLSAGAGLLVQPDPLVLPADRMQGLLTITNCSDGDIDWTATTKPSVTLATAGSNVLPGETQKLTFVIDDDAWAPGAIEFKIKVSEPGANHYVDVHAYDTVFGGEAVAGNGQLSAGAGVGGCSQQCITSAWLTPNLSTPAVSLDLRTNTPATLKVWVSTAAPQFQDGVPGFGGLAPMATSGPGRTDWTTVLSPLQPATTYHLVVSATDADGDIAHRWTTFTTLTPMDGPGGLVAPDGPAGCAAQCITSAIVTPDGAVQHLSVASHTAARFQVSVGLDAPTVDDGVAQLADSVFWANSGEQYATDWQVDLTDLAPGTTHHIVVSATDAEGRTSYRIGQFQTPAAPIDGTVITLHRIEVTYDGDAGSNRGEVSWAWGLGDLTIATWGERKMDDGDRIDLAAEGTNRTWISYGEMLPTLYVNSAERDADGAVEFCSADLAVVRTSPTHVHQCDISVNAASTGIMTADGIGALPRCIDLGLELGLEFGPEGLTPDARCMWIGSTVGEGYDTEFRALLSFVDFI